MKITKRKIAVLLATLSIAAVGCDRNKTDIFDGTEETVTIRSMVYSIDGNIHHVSLRTDAEWYNFLERMFALARKGHRVSFCSEESFANGHASKEVVTYDTNNKDKAIEWCEIMASLGYVVEITFDDETGLYHCKASR